MSLNGLDASAVNEAHQNALADQAGWFLLKYASRDTVELLSKGSGGVNGVRAAVEKYEEKSPLYGLVQYRRKKVILKFVPEGTSRLLQVRLTVQFQSVLDSFPHDAVFSFTSATELSESALGLCTMSLPAVSLTSSSSSLRRRRLDEITEDAEEATPVHIARKELPPTARPESTEPKSTADEELPPSALKARALLARLREERESGTLDRNESDQTIRSERPSTAEKSQETMIPPRYDSLSPQTVQSHTRNQSPATVTSVNKALPPPPTGSSPPETSAALAIDTERSSVSRAHQSRDGAESTKQDKESFSQSPHLSAAESSSISRWTDEVIAAQFPLPKIKKKYGPRPHVESSSSTRPHTAGNTEESTSRRVANLPTSVRISSRTTTGGQTRPGSQQSSRSVPGRFALSVDLPPPLPSPTQQIASYFQAQSYAPSITSSINEQAGPPPEKLRLMKALQMRKRNQLVNPRALGNSPGPIPEVSKSTSEHNPDVNPPTESSAARHGSKVRTPELNNHPESNTATPTSIVTGSENTSTKPSSFADSVIDKPSRGSISSDTNSSTTPKADDGQTSVKKASKAAPGAKVQKEKGDEAAEKISTPVMSPVDEALLKLTSSEASEATIEEPKPRKEQVINKNKPLPMPTSAAAPAPAPAIPRKQLAVPQRGIKMPTSAETSDLSDNEDFLDELQNATFEQAKPMVVARTPVTPVVAKHSHDKLRELARVISPGSPTTSHSNVSSPEEKRSGSRAGSTRSVSTALPQWPPSGQDSVSALPKQKLTIGSSISKRIKALEGISNRDSTVVREPPQRSSAFSQIMKRSTLVPSIQAPSASTDRPKTTNPSDTRPSNRPTFQRKASTPQPGQQPQRESVSVTARIVRDPRYPGSSRTDLHDSAVTLRQSHLTVEREARESSETQTREPSSQTLDSSARSPTSSRRRFSISSYKSNSQARLPQSESKTRLSFAGSMKKLSISKLSSDASSVAEDKKESRANRMLKRISDMTAKRGSIKDALPSPTKSVSQHDTIEEKVEPEVRFPSIDTSTLNVVEIGEVNVQFPETLLWKRRSLRIDDQGFLIFAPSTNDGTTRARSRKFHLADFKTPTLPDHEREEMAWSILMDLKEGGCVQCACENKHAQQAVLKLLLDAHSAYQQLYG